MQLSQIRRPSFSDFFTVVLVILAAFVIQRAWEHHGFLQDPIRHQTVVDGSALASVGQLLGNPEAAVRIVEFADFQCPGCRAAHQVLEDLMDAHDGQFAVVFRHFPLDLIHPEAFSAAVASECAGEQGAFPAYHKLLFQHQDEILSLPWLEMAARAGVSDTATFSACLAEQRGASAVLRDWFVADSIGIRGTPAFVVRNRLIVGATAELKESIQEALALITTDHRGRAKEWLKPRFK